MSSAVVQPPPYMLGERPTPLHGGNGAPSFRQVPFVRVSERVESGIRVRKQLRKYLKASSSTQHLVAQMHLSVTSMQPQEVAQSCLANFFDLMKNYNQTVGQKHLAASKAYLEMTRPLDNSGKSRKWARDVYNQVQKSVQDVGAAERKMEKARGRQERGLDELLHWKKVLDANEATYLVQPNNPEVIRAYQLAQYRYSNAVAEDEGAAQEFAEARDALYASISRRDQVVEEATELSQAMEEDRLDTMLIVMNQFVETKVAILQAEIEAMVEMQRVLREMDRESVVQQYIVDSMQPELTHRHATALYLLEWHRHWHSDQAKMLASEPSNFVALSKDDAALLKVTGISSTDVDVIKDFVASCFVDPEEALQSAGSRKGVSSKHRNRFGDPSSMPMYRMAVVRHALVHCLNHQRTHTRELSADGFDALATALRLVLDACTETDDTRTTKQLMNMLQTFYRETNGEKVYLQTALHDHAIWSIPQYWGNALLVSIGEELSHLPQEQPWYFLSGAERGALVIHVHNTVFGQVTSFVYNMQTFGFSRKQIRQYVQNVCFAYELAEDQRIALLSSVESLDDTTNAASPRRTTDTGEEVHFTSLTLSDWTQLGGSDSAEGGGQKFRPLARGRAHSTESDFSTVSSVHTVVTLRDFDTPRGVTASGVSSSADEETWEDLFGAGGAPINGASTASVLSDEGGGDSESEKIKRMKKRKSSRKFNDQLRMARALPLSQRIHGGVDASDTCSVISENTSTSPSTDARPEPEEAPPKPPVSAPPRPAVEDDTASVRSQRTLERKRSRRLVKARSAASIDTSALRMMDERSDAPQQQRQAEASVPPPSSNASSSASGMDQIKLIAAKMKQRREGSTPSLSSSSASLPSESSSGQHHLPVEVPPRPRRLSRPASHNSLPIPRSTPQATPTAEQLSGVAALRARFEKV